MRTDAPRSYLPEALVPALVLMGVCFSIALARSDSWTRFKQLRAAPVQPAIVAPAAPAKPVEASKLLERVKPGAALARSGDEIVVCGQLFHTTAPVVLWMDPGGYDAYRTESRFAAFENSDWEKAGKLRKDLGSPNRFGLRKDLLTPDELERVRGGGWKLSELQEKVDQFVLHYDQAGVSRSCFKVLHDIRCLSVHFMLDLDGTLYQTLDLKERAWHATTSNSRSIGIEIANIGAYAPGDDAQFERCYSKDGGGTHLKIPPDAGLRVLNFHGAPARAELIEGVVQGKTLRQYDFTPQQYDTLIKLTATLCKVFPKIDCDYPRDESGKPIARKLPDEQLKKFHGILGHYHIQSDKIDPGPALQWDALIEGARELK